MKKLLYIPVLAFLFFLLYPLPNVFASESYGTLGEVVKEKIQKFNTNYKSKLYIKLDYSIKDQNGNNYNADESVASDEKYRAIVYGGPDGAKAYYKKYLSGTGLVSPFQTSATEPNTTEPRYLGLSPDKELIPNWNFPVDAYPTTSRWTVNWEKEFWYNPSLAKKVTPKAIIPELQYSEETALMIQQTIFEEDIQNLMEYHGYTREKATQVSQAAFDKSIFANNPSLLSYYFAVISPQTPYTAFSCIGWHYKSSTGTYWYDTFSIPPSKPTLDLEMEIISLGIDKYQYAPNDALPKTFTATARVTLKDASNMPAAAKPVPITFKSIFQGKETKLATAEFNFIGKKEGDYFDVNLEWPTQWSTDPLVMNDVVLIAEVNPPNNAGTRVVIDSVDEKLSFPESDQTNNIDGAIITFSRDEIIISDFPDLSIEITDPGVPAKVDRDAEPFTFNAKARVTLSKDLPASVKVGDIKIKFYTSITSENGTTRMSTPIIVPLNISTNGSIQEVDNLTWEAFFNDTIQLIAEVNYEVNNSRVVAESTYDNNISIRYPRLIDSFVPTQTTFSKITLPASENIKQTISAVWNYLPTKDGACPWDDGTKGDAIGTVPTFSFPWLNGNMSVTSASTHDNSKYCHTWYHDDNPDCPGHTHYVDKYTTVIASIPSKSDGTNPYHVPNSYPDGDYSLTMDSVTAPLSGNQQQTQDITVYTPIWKTYTDYYTYTDIPDSEKIRINPGSKYVNQLVTYEKNPNVLVFKTSKYTTKIDVTFNPGGTNMLATLEKDFNSSNAPKVILSDAIKNSKAIYNTELTVDTTSSSLTRTWTFKFKLRNYVAYPEPKPEEVQKGNIKVVAYDLNGDYDKTAHEGNPIITKEVTLKQTRLSKLKIADVKDVYWKNTFRNADGTLKSTSAVNTSKMPLQNGTADNRYVSKGYAVRFDIESEGLNSNEDQISVRPSFWWKDASGNYREVYLYYDVTNKNQYNIRVSDTTDHSNNTEYAKVVVKPDLKYFGTSKQDDMLLSGRKTTAVNTNNIWTFTYSLHPRTKAFLRSDIDSGKKPENLVPLTGTILVNFKIIANRVDYDNANNKVLSNYHYTVYEPNWGASGPLASIDAGAVSSGSTAIDSKTGTGHGFTILFNLDRSALDDYSTQQGW